MVVKRQNTRYGPLGWSLKPDMTDIGFNTEPVALAAIVERSKAMDFRHGSKPEVGALLRVVAASKPGGKLLELGTGTGIGTCWLLDGMDSGARITTVDIDPIVQTVARANLGRDPRLTFLTEDSGAFLRRQTPISFDLIFADSPPGKHTGLDDALVLLRPGGLYICDDVKQDSEWPPERTSRVQRTMDALGSRRGFRRIFIALGSGVVILAKMSA